MPARHALSLLLLLAVALFLPGCASLEPNRVTVSYERDESESTAARRQRTATDKLAVAATYDLR